VSVDDACREYCEAYRQEVAGFVEKLLKLIAGDMGVKL